MLGKGLHPQLSQFGSVVLGWMDQHEECPYPIHMFSGKMDQLFFELVHWWWHVVNPFLAFTTKLGRKWITTQEVFKK